jgi:hypothetical protein
VKISVDLDCTYGSSEVLDGCSSSIGQDVGRRKWLM